MSIRMHKKIITTQRGSKRTWKQIVRKMNEGKKKVKKLTGKDLKLLRN
jgi:hypothetical protein